MNKSISHQVIMVTIEIFEVNSLQWLPAECEPTVRLYRKTNTDLSRIGFISFVMPLIDPAKSIA
jgi:hypothetical protein